MLKQASRIILLLAVSCIIKSDCADLNGTACGIPVNVPGIMLDPSKLSPDDTPEAKLIVTMLGVWYEYMYRAPGMEDINCINAYTPLGMTSLPGAMAWAVAVSWSASGYIKQSKPTCMGEFTQANFTVNGKRMGQEWMEGQATPTPALYTTLYTDYKTVELNYRCNSESKENQNGTCRDPYFWLNTRIHPLKMRPWHRVYAQNVINQILQPYCVSVGNFSQTSWDLSLPACNPKPPPAFSEFVRGLRSSGYQYPTQLAV